MRKSIKKALSLALAAAMVVGLGSGATTASALSVALKDVPNTTAPYMSYLTFQTGTMYNFRNAVDDKDYGVVASAKQKDVKGTYDYANTFIWNKAKSDKMKDATYTPDGEKNSKTIQVPAETELTATAATFQNPSITGDGTYTASMTGDLTEVFKYDQLWQMLGVTTTIPRAANPNVKFTNVSLSVDGQVLYTAAEGVARNVTDSKNLWTFMVINRYGYADYNKKEQNAKKDGVPDVILNKGPKSSISITFTVSGLSGAAGATTTSGAAVTSGSATASQTAVTSLKKGKTFTAGNLVYKVTKASKKSGAATVAVSGVTKSGTKKAALSVPKTVKNKKFTYKVTAVNKKAFAKAKKLKKVTLGANVKTIDKKAFSGCKKLKALKLSAKLSKVGKGAFSGCKNTIKVSGTAKKANVKLLKKSGYKKFK